MSAKLGRRALDLFAKINYLLCDVLRSLRSHPNYNLFSSQNKAKQVCERSAVRHSFSVHNLTDTHRRQIACAAEDSNPIVEYLMFVKSKNIIIKCTVKYDGRGPNDGRGTIFFIHFFAFFVFSEKIFSEVASHSAALNTNLKAAI